MHLEMPDEILGKTGGMLGPLPSAEGAEHTEHPMDSLAHPQDQLGRGAPKVCMAGGS